MFAAGFSSSLRAWGGWPIVGGLAVLVIAALVGQVQAAADAADDPEAEAHFADVDGQTMLLAAALVIVASPCCWEQPHWVCQATEWAWHFLPGRES